MKIYALSLVLLCIFFTQAAESSLVCQYQMNKGDSFITSLDSLRSDVAIIKLQTNCFSSERLKTLETKIEKSFEGARNSYTEALRLCEGAAKNMAQMAVSETMSIKTQIDENLDSIKSSLEEKCL